MSNEIGSINIGKKIKMAINAIIQSKVYFIKFRIDSLYKRHNSFNVNLKISSIKGNTLSD
jgi:hypothetical protein